MRVMFLEEGYGVEDRQILLRVQGLSEEHAAELALDAAGNQTFDESCEDFLQDEDEPAELPSLESIHLNANDDELSDYVVRLVRRGWLSASGTNNDAEYAVVEVSPAEACQSFVFPSPENLAARRAKTLERKQAEQLSGMVSASSPRVRM